MPGNQWRPTRQYEKESVNTSVPKIKAESRKDYNKNSQNLSGVKIRISEKVDTAKESEALQHNSNKKVRTENKIHQTKSKIENRQTDKEMYRRAYCMYI